MKRLFLTGLSGSGKTTIGRRTASLLGWSFVDTDEMLAERAAMPVGQLLVERGEERFRQLESEVLRELAGSERVVASTGGGMVIAEANRQFMREHGLTVYLQATVDTAWRRIQASGNQALRPLIAGEHGLQHLSDLYAARRAWYEEAVVHIDTEEGSVDDLARRIIAQALALGTLSAPHLPQEIIALRLTAATSQAIVEWEGLPRLGETLRKFECSKRLFIVTDSHVSALFAGPLQDLLREAGFLPFLFTMPAGEASKSLRFFERAIDWLVEHRVERKEAIVAFGGGVVGDLAGFLASCYQRGVPCIQVPTTLLAQVDSAIGGKTGINHALGKNLIGSYYQPLLTYVDPAFILTLPERIYREGLAEIVKYAVILDADLFALLEESLPALQARDPALLTSIIARSIRIKMDVVQQDELDFGLRNILNYGHTFGHALEAITDYGMWLHGEAVAIGMEVAARIAVASGTLSREGATRQTALLQALELPVRCPGIDVDHIMHTMQRDKKVRAGRTRWILPTRIGHAEMHSDIDEHLARAAIREVCGEQAILS
jgi:3-dehydroquinate synthase